MFQIGSDHLEGGWVLFLRVRHEAFWSRPFNLDASGAQKKPIYNDVPASFLCPDLFLKSLLFDNQIDNPYNFSKQYGI